MTAVLASRIFTQADQIAFAKLSSDFNPMHLDAAFARRTQMGAVVVHGIHHLTWAIDSVLRAFPVRLAHLRARFQQPLYLDEPASILIGKQSEREIAFDVVAGGAVVAHIRLSSEPGRTVATTIAPATNAAAPLSEPVDLALEQLAGRSGTVRVPPGDVRSRFPALATSIGPASVKRLLATSQIVGTRCLPASTSALIRQVRHRTIATPPSPMPSSRSIRASARCRSMSRATAPAAGSRRSRDSRRRRKRAWPRSLLASGERRLPASDRSSSAAREVSAK
jgi:acyl dehydratase